MTNRENKNKNKNEAEADPKTSPKLQALRVRINELDEKLVTLLNERAKVVVDVGKAKLIDGTSIYAPDREQAVLQRVIELNDGPLPNKTLQAIHRELMSGSLALEKPLRIGYLGPEGSFSHLAAQRKFGASVEYHPVADIRAVFEEVTRGHCDLGLVPIENSVGGGVIDTLDAFIEAQVYICAEVIVEIRHNLLAKCSVDELRVVASKPEVFAQCRKWLSTMLNEVQLVPVASSAKAAEMAAGEHGLGAIGSTLAAELYGLQVLFANIEDNPNNQTRFFAISRQPAKRTGNDKTALVFTTAHKSGALVEVLNILARNGINLTNIDTRPSQRRNWEYYFFVDAVGHCEDENFKKAMEECRGHCGDLHVLGSFPKAVAAV